MGLSGVTRTVLLSLQVTARTIVALINNSIGLGTASNFKISAHVRLVRLHRI